MVANEQQTVRVRIAVAVDRSGQWAACGGPSVADDWHGAMDCMLNWIEEGEARYWVEAELPIPRGSYPVVEGEITTAIEEGE